jgi:hypothetical protein
MEPAADGAELAAVGGRAGDKSDDVAGQRRHACARRQDAEQIERIRRRHEHGVAVVVGATGSA